MTVSAFPSDSAAVVAARTRAWVETAVIGLNLCPFAKSVAVNGQIAYRVSAADTVGRLRDELEAALRELAAADPAQLDTLLLIHPQVLTDFDDYNAFLPVADEVLRLSGLAGTLQIASFHPDYRFADAPASAIEHATNRSPYPILHLLREHSIAQAVAGHPDPSRIYRRNVATLRKLGWHGWDALAATWQKDPPQP